MTTDPFADAAYAESRQQWPMRDQRSAFESGARWAQRYLAAQEPTDAEVEAAADVLEIIDGMDFRDVARAALSAARAARRDEKGAP